MTPGEVAPWGIAGVLTLKEAYSFFTAGQKFDDRIKKHIADDKASNVKADDLVSLRAGDVTLFRGRMGSVNDRIAVRIEEETLHEPRHHPE